jgi:hypothetical protein
VNAPVSAIACDAVSRRFLVSFGTKELGLVRETASTAKLTELFNCDDMMDIRGALFLPNRNDSTEPEQLTMLLYDTRSASVMIITSTITP